MQSKDPHAKALRRKALNSTVMPSNESLWRTLHLGDVVRVVYLPYESSQRDYTMHDGTRAVYRHLIESRRELSINRIDELGYPWVEFAIKADNGDTEYHDLMLNHDGIEIVRRHQS